MSRMNLDLEGEEEAKRMHALITPHISRRNFVGFCGPNGQMLADRGYLPGMRSKLDQLQPGFFFK